MRRPATVILFALLIAVVMAFAVLSDLLVDWLWFDALGFGPVFVTVWQAKVAAFAVAAGVSWVVLAVNGLLAARAPALRVRKLRLVRNVGNGEELPEVIDLSLEALPWREIMLTFASVLGPVLGLEQAGHWELFLKMRHALPFCRVAQALWHDLGFCFFSL